MSVKLRNRGGVGMVLIDADIAKRIPGLWAQAETADPVVHLRLFTVTGWRWFVLGLDPVALTAYCYVTAPGVPIEDGDFGIVHLAELGDLSLFGGSLGVERDLLFTPRPLSKLLKMGALK